MTNIEFKLPKTNSQFAPEKRPFDPKGSRIVFQPWIFLEIPGGYHHGNLRAPRPMPSPQDIASVLLGDYEASLSQWTLKKKVWTLFSLLNM